MVGGLDHSNQRKKILNAAKDALTVVTTVVNSSVASSVFNSSAEDCNSKDMESNELEEINCKETGTNGP